jgi:hypothetical protein
MVIARIIIVMVTKHTRTSCVRQRRAYDKNAAMRDGESILWDLGTILLEHVRDA